MSGCSNQKLSCEHLPSYWRPAFTRIAAPGTASTRHPTQPSLSRLNLRTILLAIHDMPYARPSGMPTAVESCLTEWRGTCTAKHLAVYELLHTMHVPTRLWLASYQINFQDPYYPPKLDAEARGMPVYDVHTFVTCEIAGRDTLIDVTFPRHLGARGLPVTPDWHEGQNFTLCCKPERIVEVTRPHQLATQKNAWLAALNDRHTQHIREQAIQALMAVAT